MTATATATATSAPETFVTVPGDRHSEVAHTLAEPVPKALSLVDQLGLWGNLGVSLLGFTGAIFVLQPGGAGTPELSICSFVVAAVVTLIVGGPTSLIRPRGAAAPASEQHTTAA